MSIVLPYTKSFKTDNSTRVLIVSRDALRAQRIVKKLVRSGYVPGVGKTTVLTTNDKRAKTWKKTLRGAIVSVDPLEPVQDAVLVLDHGVSAEPKTRTRTLICLTDTIKDDDGRYTHVLVADPDTIVHNTLTRFDAPSLVTPDNVKHVLGLYLALSPERAVCFSADAVSLVDLEQPMKVTARDTLEVLDELEACTLDTSVNLVIGKRLSGKTTLVRRQLKVDGNFDELHVVTKSSRVRNEWLECREEFGGCPMHLHDTVAAFLETVDLNATRPRRALVVEDGADDRSSPAALDMRSYKITMWCVAQMIGLTCPNMRAHADRVFLTAGNSACDTKSYFTDVSDRVHVQHVRDSVCREPGLALEYLNFVAPLGDPTAARSRLRAISIL